MRSISLVGLSIIAGAMLAACASIPLKTVYNLWNFDPWTSDFRAWRAAVRIPEGRGLNLAGARVVMKVETWRNGDRVRQAENFVLDRSADAADLALLAAEKRPGFALAVFRFAPADYARMEALRAKILASKKNGEARKGSLTIGASSCEGPAAVPVEGGFPFSTFLMVDAKDGYNPLLVDYDLGPELRTAAAKGGMPDVCKTGK
jgi:hypothetical protein